MQKPQGASGWRDQEYNEAVSVKDKLYRRSIQIKTRATKEAYRSKRREVVKMAKLKKRRFEKQQFEELEFMRDRLKDSRTTRTQVVMTSPQNFSPEEWNVSIICPVHKKGDRSDC